MCGICGILTTDGAGRDPGFDGSLRSMTARLERRGPDAEGFWTDPDGRLRLGFRRLAILDLSDQANQPMLSSDGRSVVVFNGELYNYRELGRRLETEGVRFRTRSDTEVLLEALARWGEDAVSLFNGMFAFAWYRLDEGRLLLARDHAGIKPLYWYRRPGGRGLAFASQYDCLLDAPWGEPSGVREDVLRLYLRLHHVPAPYGLLRDTGQVRPGHWVAVGPDGSMEEHRWWEMPDDVEPDLRGDVALDALAGALEDAVRRQRISDVPLGVFLSGGVDSPLVTAVARSQAGPSLRAFTIAAPGSDRDESKEAGRLASLLDVDHRVRPMEGDDAAVALGEVIQAQHEPFADFSILPTLEVSRFARETVTVALSGDGGDELFYGYDRQRSLIASGGAFRWPRPLRLAMYAAGRLGLGPPRRSLVARASPGRYYLEVNSRLKDAEVDVLAPGLAALPDGLDLYRYEGWRGSRQLAQWARKAEFEGMLQRVLKKVDMASMRYGLEVRVPILDRAVIETALRIDPAECVRDGTGKVILRRLLARHVPAAEIAPGKKGFGVPLGRWLDESLGPNVEETLLDGELYPAGVFDRGAVERYVRAHRKGGRPGTSWGIWTLLSLQWWADSRLGAGTAA